MVGLIVKETGLQCATPMLRIAIRRRFTRRQEMNYSVVENDPRKSKSPITVEWEVGCIHKHGMYGIWNPCHKMVKNIYSSNLMF